MGERHIGDLGNIQTDKNGKAVIDITDHLVKLSGGEAYNVIDRSIVIHQNEDDLGTSGDASGNAGKRLKCCKIFLEDSNGATSQIAKVSLFLLIIVANFLIIIQ